MSVFEAFSRTDSIAYEAMIVSPAFKALEAGIADKLTKESDRLISASTWEEACRYQGAIRALEGFHSLVFSIRDELKKREKEG